VSIVPGSWKMRLSCVTAILLAGACATMGWPQFRIVPGKIDETMGCIPKTPARICLDAGMAHCYAPASDKDYTFGMEPKATPVGKLGGQPLVLFSAMFSGCGSGTLTDYSLLTIRAGEFANLLPKVRLTNQSEYRLWALPQISNLPILATADFIWDFKADETHFAAHRYHVEAFVFDTKSGRYVQRVCFDTAKKYPGLDEVDQIRVLEAERAVILAKLR